MTIDETPSRDESRHAPDRSESGAPVAGKAVYDKFTTDEIFQRIVASAEEEIRSGNRELFFSGLAAGFAITLTFLGHAVAASVASSELAASVLYPIGFVYIIMGRYQLYTENTLPPVALVLTRLASVPRLLTVWTVVLAGNVVGAALGAFVLANGSVLSPEAAQAAVGFGKEGLEIGWWALFYKAVFAGWLVAGVVWLDHAARDTITRFVLVYFVFYTISAGHLYHVVVTACDALYLVFVGQAALVPAFWEFWFPVLLGNTLGGVVLVTLVNYAQTGTQRIPEPDVRPRLSTRRWLLGGGRFGRS